MMFSRDLPFDDNKTPKPDKDAEFRPRCTGCGHEFQNSNDDAIDCDWGNGYYLCVVCTTKLSPFERMALDLLVEMRDEIMLSSAVNREGADDEEEDNEF